MTDPTEDQRLNRLVDYIVQLASGDLTARMEASAARDTVDAVITGFNMLATELSDVYSDFDARVKERTGRLEALHLALEQQALADGLTGLANRTLLRDRINQAVQEATEGADQPAVLLLDLDGFKTINDSLGHDAGDQVLIEVAHRLTAAVRVGDTVARLGGDEFAIVLPGVAGQSALEVAQRALTALTPAITIAQRQVWARASIGLRHGEPGLTAELLLRDADTAMYAAKAQGRGNVQVFRPVMHHAVQRRLQVAADLRTGIPAGQLVLMYQPIVDLDTGALVAAEALVRWQHPTQGLVAPGEFIPIAEDSGLIGDVSQWVTAEATRQLAGWAPLLNDYPGFRLHLNASSVELRRGGLVKHLQAALSASGVTADQLVVEISETAVMPGEPEQLRMMQDLRNIGVALSIDDFGTGFTSIAHLRRLPVEMVKMDQSLIVGIETDAQQWDFVGAVLRLIESAGLVAVIEGIESPGEAQRLAELGCRFGQGFAFCRPMTGAQFARTLTAGRVFTAEGYSGATDEGVDG